MSEGLLSVEAGGRNRVASPVPAPSPEVATRILQSCLNTGARVVHCRRLYGGSVNRVMEWTTDGDPVTVVAKLNRRKEARSFQAEFDSLRWLADQTRLPVPEAYALVKPVEGFEGSGLLMQTMPGRTLAAARMSPQGVEVFEHQLAQHLSRLHRHTRDRFGAAVGGSKHETWLDVFSPLIHDEFAAVRSLLNTPTRDTIDHLLHHLPRYLPERSTPTATHGDLWANNILIDDAHPDRPHITAFIDSIARFCDPEYELAYLRLFRTTGKTFTRYYQQVHPRRPGFSLRCRIYWLKTMMRHVRIFGERYVPSVENLTLQVRQLLPAAAKR